MAKTQVWAQVGLVFFAQIGPSGSPGVFLNSYLSAIRSGVNVAVVGAGH